MNRSSNHNPKEVWEDIGQMINITSFMWRIISHDDVKDDVDVVDGGRHVGGNVQSIVPHNVTRHVNITIDPLSPTYMHATQAVYMAAAILLTIVVIVGVAGNSLVIYVIGSNQRFRTVTNLLLLNLSLADLLFLLVCGTLGVLHRGLGEWLVGDSACRLMQYLLYVTCYVTIYTITAVAVVRYVIVIQERPGVPPVDKRGIACTIGVAWLFLALLNVPIILIHGLFLEPATASYECLVISVQRARELYATFFVFAYALPLTVIATLYILIVRHIKRRETACSLLQSKRAAMERRERHIVRAAIVVVAVFAVCWLPLHVHLLVAHYGGHMTGVTSRLLLVIWHVLAYSNSVLNPIIYNLFCHEFRVATLRLLKIR